MDNWSKLSSHISIVASTIAVSAVVVDKDVYIIGGMARLCLRYRYKKNQWEVLEQPNEVYLYTSGVYVNGRIIMTGGKNNDPEIYTRSAEEYIIATNTWKRIKLEYEIQYLILSP